MDTTFLRMEQIAKLSFKIGMIIVAIGALFKMGIYEGRSDVINLLPRPQQAIVQRVLRSGLKEKQIRENQHELQEAQAAIESARRAITSGLRDDALNWIINARGHLAKVNKKAFDITKLQAELQLIQRTMFSPRAQ